MGRIDPRMREEAGKVFRFYCKSMPRRLAYWKVVNAYGWPRWTAANAIFKVVEIERKMALEEADRELVKSGADRFVLAGVRVDQEAKRYYCGR